MRVLIVDDEFSMREYLELLLAKWGHDVQVYGTVEGALTALTTTEVDLVISDLKVGSDTGFRVLKVARALPFPPEVIIITAFGTPATAIEAVREGAYDYICKPFDNAELKLLVTRALEKREIRGENLRLRQSLVGASSMVGKSAAVAQVLSLIDKVAASPRSTVLITGESGTGKELVARAIHTRSDRSGGPFMAINCAALAEGVLESELFGHVKGAYTGATSDREGLLVAAQSGTLFLDEIGEISPAIQVKLLRVLQERTLRPVGGTQEVKFEARIVAATNKVLEQEVTAGRFREDLLYRLNVITIEVPPLRARREDIPLLAQHFLNDAAEELGRPGLHFVSDTVDLLSRYDFPGNVRQLANIVERAATLSSGDEVKPESLPPALRGEVETSSGQPHISLSGAFSLERFLDEAESRYLKEALRQAGGVKGRAAELLGLSFRSFRYRLAKHGLE
ncbi:MAG: sigma-54 dependent transcriptional regulator [Myxococcaceae bacterium]|nr:sigma-54 dependent transcriptional regulator [Myxococcaceae bacterium]